MSRRRTSAGQVLPLIALALSTLMGFGGVAVDVGFLEYRQQVQQTATDAAALGGAEVLARSSCDGQSNAVSAADGDAGSNGFAGNTVTANSPPQIGPYASDDCAIGVQITTPQVQTFFARVLGISSMPESTQAVAAVTPITNAAPCIYLLNPSVDQNMNGANVQAPQCAIFINDTANFNGSTVNAAEIGYAGGAPNENGSTFTEATPQPILPIADPCPTIPGCAYLAANPPSTSNCESFNGNGYRGALAPGCYSSLNLNGANVTMSGEYVFNGSSNFNGATINGTGVTMYVTPAGTPPNFNGASVSFTPPTTGGPAGVVYYQVPANPGSANFNGSSNYYSGLIYSPGGSDVNFNGTGGGYVVLVFGGINFNGAGVQDFAPPSAGGGLVTKAVIVE